LTALALAFACALFVVALVVRGKGNTGVRRDTRLAATDVM
jgi:hypothetical protein